MQTQTELTKESAGLNALEHADQRALNNALQLPPIIVFDTDSKRMGRYGGFFLADDYNAKAYSVAGAPSSPDSHERVNSPTNRIPGTHLPDRTHFALVAAGPLFSTNTGDNTVFHFEAIVFCKEITRKDNGELGLFKLTIKGPAAVKLNNFFIHDVKSALKRMNLHYHALAQQLFEKNQITQQRLEQILQNQTTNQIIWLPVDILREQQVGRDQEKSIIGTMIFTDRPVPNTDKFESRWPEISLEQLITPDTEPEGLLLNSTLQNYCQNNRLYYEQILTTRAKSKGQIQQLLPNQPAPFSEAPFTNPTPDPNNLINQIRAGLSLIGKRETDPDVSSRMKQFGAPTLQTMGLAELSAFNIYVTGYARLKQQSTFPSTPATQANTSPA